MQPHQTHIQSLKTYMIESLKAAIPNIAFNGDIDPEKSLYTVLNVSFPKTEKSEMLLFNLDINHICASGGSDCASGAEEGSHVIRAVNYNPNQIAVRFSFSRHNTKEEIDQLVEKLKELL
jgi:cysteine desulfurase